MATFPTNQLIGSPTTLIVSSGALKASVGSIITSYASTAAADANAYIKDYAGADIVIANDNRYYRNQAASAWILHYTSTNFGVGNLSPLFTASIVNPTTAPVLTFAMSNAAMGTVLNNSAGSVAVPIYTANMFLGETGVTGGSIGFRSATAGGVATLQLSGSSGNYNFNLPLSAGTLGQALLSGGGGTAPHTYGTVLTGVTADNGLTANTATNIRLGGTLLANTTIDTAGFTLTISTATALINPLFVSATTGRAIHAQNSTSSETVIYAQNTSTGIGIHGLSSGGGVGGVFETIASSTNTIIPIMHVRRYCGGTAADGIGGSINMWVEHSDGAAELTTELISYYPDLPTRSADFVIKNQFTNTREVFRVKGSGQIQGALYGAGTFGGTPTFNLQVDSSGNIIETESVVESASGLYTPTLTNSANITTSTAYECQYMRVGDVVTVSGKFFVEFLIGNAVSRLGISLPIASAFSADQQCGGAANSNSISSGCFAIRADTPNNIAEFYAVAPNTSLTETYWFTFTYYIVPA